MSQAGNNLSYFRNFAPYINAHRNKTFVVMFGGEAVAHDNFKTLIHDFALLHALGIRLVLVHGARPQIEQNLKEANLPSQVHKDIRQTPSHCMPHILEAVGAIRLQIEAQLSMGLINSPMHGAHIDAVSGNFVTARPFGIQDGIDHQMTGVVRAIDVPAIAKNLDNGHIVILGSIGFANTGEIFNLLAEEVALKTALALEADKLIFLGECTGIYEEGRLLSDMIPNEVDRFLADADDGSEMHFFLKYAAVACRGGIHRTHLISYAKDGALIEELFTRDGSGTLISHDPYEEIRHAKADDVVRLLALLKPLEEAGVLVSRDKKRLEDDIDQYSLIERDGMILGCAALKPLSPQAVEFTSMAIHPDYRGASRGADLLAFMQDRARALGYTQMFALTTRTKHWFLEQGFEVVDVAQLPAARQATYDTARNSCILKKYL